MNPIGARERTDFPRGWSYKRVLDFGKVLTGSTPPTLRNEYWNGDLPWVTPTDISAHRDICVTERLLTPLGRKVSRPLPAGTVLVTCIASIGKNAILTAAGSCNQQINAIIPHQAFNAAFLYYLFENNEPFLQRSAGTTATSIISKNTFSRLNFCVPERKVEQEAIAEALSDADAYIESLEQLLAKKRDIKQGVMLALLSGKTRLPSFDKKLGFRTVEHLMVPADWKVVEAGTIGRFRGGSGFPVSYQGLTGGKIPFFKVSDMNSEGNEILLKVANNYISEISRKRLGAKSFPAKTVAFAKVGAAVFLERKRLLGQESCLDNNMAGFTLFDDTIDYRFIYHALLLVRLGSLVATTALPSLNNSVLNAIKLSVPPTKIEQQAISTILSDFDTELSELELKRDKAVAVKLGMMQELLTGRTRLV